MSAVVQTRDLTIRYGTRVALSELTIRVGRGATALLGPNGAGKSTLLKTLLGFIPPAGGVAEVLGMTVGLRSLDIRLRVGYLPEQNAFVPGLSAVETVALAGELGGLPRTVALERAHEVLRFTGLGDARYRLMESYSSGMLQRAKLAVALVHDPELAFLDEPTSGMDPFGRRQMLDLIRQLDRRHGISVVLSTHLLHDVEEVCGSVALLKAGRLVLHGDLETLKRSPGGVFEVWARERTPGSFSKALSSRGALVGEGKAGMLHVRLKEADARVLFEAARSAGAEIRHLRPFERGLEELFLSAVANEAEEV